MKKVILGLSGGVDSSVALQVLKSEGYDVEAMFMRNWDSATNNDILGNPDLDEDVCPQEKDFQDAKLVADALGVTETITSPTFNIIKEYEGELPLYHMDVYRLNGKVDDLGLEEYYKKGGVVVIEWADMIEDYLPEERLDIKIKAVDEDVRVIKIIPHGSKYEEICEAVL